MEFELFVVRQHIQAANGGHIIVVHEGRHFREAEMFYDSVIKNHPNEYFEFCKIYKKETCIAFVKRDRHT